MRLSPTVTVSLRRWRWPALTEVWDMVGRLAPSDQIAALQGLEAHWSGRLFEVVFWVWSVLIDLVLTLFPRSQRGWRGDHPFTVVRWLAWQVVIGDRDLPPGTVVLPPLPAMSPLRPPPVGKWLTPKELEAFAARLTTENCHNRACPSFGLRGHACHDPNCQEHKS